METASGSIDARLMNLLDRAEISDVIGRYCYGLDTRDWKMFRSCFADEIELDVPEAWSAGTGTKAKIRAEDWIEIAKAFTAEMPKSQHLKLPISFEFDGDEAEVLSAMQGKHLMPNAFGDPISTVVGYYRDHYRRTDKGWKQVAFEEIVFWHEGNWHVLEFNLGKMMDKLQAAVRRNAGATAQPT